MLLIGGWTCVQAQSLGTPVADVLLGRPLDMSLPARFNTTDGDECVHADVFYGETRVKASDVRATITGPQDQRRIRIESSAPVDEPVVTVSVRAGCRNTVTRNYTLLPEYPSERLLAALDARIALAAATPAAPLKLAKATAPAGPGPRRSAAPRTVVAQAPTEAAPAPRNPHGTRTARKSVVAAGPRLRLEPIDMPEQQGLLRVSNSLAQPDGDPARRAAAALLWQAINADPQEVLRTMVMLQKLERDLVQLRQSAGQTRAEMAALRARLDQAQPWYLSPALVQALLVLLLAAGAGAGVLWYRTRRLGVAPGAWYLPPEEAAREPVLSPQPQAEPAEAAAPVELPAAEPVVAPLVAPVVAPVVERRAPEPQPVVAAPVRIEPVLAQEPVPAAPGPIDFEVPLLPAVAAQPAPDSMLRVEALAATFEEMDFLSSLGLTTDAMQIVKSYLQESAKPAPAAYLALMQLCEKAEDPAAVAAVRRRYAQSFGVEAPRLAQITAEGGLDSLADLSGRVTRAWGGAEALSTIEAALFTVPTPAAPMTLQAVRDLLALYDLALAQTAAGAGVQGGELAEAHALAPWAHGEGGHEGAAMEPGMPEEGSTEFGLDLDLDALAGEELQAEPVSGAATPDLELELVPMLEKLQADSARELAQKRAQEDEDAFSAAMASERVPASRY